MQIFNSILVCLVIVTTISDLTAQILWETVNGHYVENINSLTIDFNENIFVYTE